MEPSTFLTPSSPASTTAPTSSRSKLTVEAFLLEQWLPAVEGRLLPAVEGRLRPPTRANYKTNLQVHIIPALGALKLQRLTAPRIASFYSELLADGRRDGKGSVAG